MRICSTNISRNGESMELTKQRVRYRFMEIIIFLTSPGTPFYIIQWPFHQTFFLPRDTILKAWYLPVQRIFPHYTTSLLCQNLFCIITIDQFKILDCKFLEFSNCVFFFSFMVGKPYYRLNKCQVNEDVDE